MSNKAIKKVCEVQAMTLPQTMMERCVTDPVGRWLPETLLRLCGDEQQQQSVTMTRTDIAGVGLSLPDK